MNSQSTKCDIPDHELEDVLGICFDKNCSSKPEFCYLCKTEGKHKDHQGNCKNFPLLKKSYTQTKDTFIQQKQYLLDCLKIATQSCTELLYETYQKKIDDCSMLIRITQQENIQESKAKIDLLDYYFNFERDKIRQFIEQIKEICEEFKEKINEVIRNNVSIKQNKSIQQDEQIIESQISNKSDPNQISQKSSDQDQNFLKESQVSIENVQIVKSEKIVDFDPKKEQQKSQNDEIDNEDNVLQLQIKMIELFEQEQKIQQSEQLIQQAKQNISNPQIAIKLLDQAIELFENNEDALLLKGSILFKNDQFHESLNVLEKCIKLNSKSVEALTLYAECLQRLNKLQEADKFYQQAIEINPKESSLYSNRGNVLNVLGFHQEAINYCDQALTLNQQNYSAYNNKAYALQHLNKLEEALVNYNKAIQLKPNSTDVLSNKGYLLLKMNRINEAVVCLNQMEQIPEKTPHYFNFKIKLLIKQGNYIEARQTYTQGLSFYPNDQNLASLKYQYGF